MPHVRKPPRPPRDQAIASIIDAAVALFADRGYEATTMQDVATRVGITAPALYHYFDSKQGLLFGVLEVNLERILTRLADPANDRSTAADQLGAFVRAHVGFQLETVDGARIYNAMFLGTGAMLRALSPAQRAKVTALQRRFRSRLDGVLAHGVATGEFAITDRQVTLMGIIALGEFAPAWFRAGGAMTADQAAERCAELAVRMVARPHPADRRNRP
jgi:AcrR family transcriptional regulator